MRRLLSRKPLRAPFVVTIAITGSISGACGGKTQSTGEPVGGMNPPATVQPGAVADASSGDASNEPQPVVLPEAGGYNPPSFVCPADLPSPHASCTEMGQCSYPSSYCPGYSDTATCEQGFWVVSEVGCSNNPPSFVPDASTDAPSAPGDAAPPVLQDAATAVDAPLG